MTLKILTLSHVSGDLSLGAESLDAYFVSLLFHYSKQRLRVQRRFMKTPFVIEAKQQTRGSCGKQRENRNRERER